MNLFSMLILISFLGFNSVENTITIAPEISLENTDGKEIKLSSLRGNIVLVDFWASWCKPCQKNRVGLNEVYDEFKSAKFQNADSFKIYSVSLDNKKDLWEKAIKSYDLNWDIHVSDLKGWKSEVISTYGIKGIPNNILINEKGEIIARNIYNEELMAALNLL